MNASLHRLAGAFGKDVAVCLARGAKGKLSMTVEACRDADVRGAVAKATQQAEKAFAKSCEGDDKAGVPRLPPFGVTDTVTIALAAATKEADLFADVLGPDLDQALVLAAADKTASACQVAIATEVGRCQGAWLKAFTACVKAGVAGSSPPIAGAPGVGACIGSDPKEAIAKACGRIGNPGQASGGKLGATLEKKCDAKGVALATVLPGCGAASRDGAHACVTTAVACRVCRAVVTATGVPRDCDVLDDGVSNASCGAAAATPTPSVTPAVTTTASPTATGGATASSTATATATPTRTATATPSVTRTATVTPTPSPTSTDTATTTPTASVTPTVTPTTTGTTTPTASPTPFVIGEHTCDLASIASGVVVNTHDFLLLSELHGAIRFDCGTVDPVSRTAPCGCELDTIEPVEVFGIGWACIHPSSGCPQGTISCGGGAPLDLFTTAQHHLGACTGNAECATSCAAACAATGDEPLESGCEGFCEGGSSDGAACFGDVFCPLGICNGPDRNLHGAICQCQCVARGGEPTPPGGLACDVGVDVIVESELPCGDGDVLFAVGPRCVPFTTATTDAVIVDADDVADREVRPDGAFIGIPRACEALAAGDLGGMSLAATANFLDAPVAGDMAFAFVMTCAPFEP